MTRGSRLTFRQREVLALLARGYSARAVAATTHYTEATVYAQCARIRAALGVATNTAAVVMAIRRGEIGMPGETEFCDEQVAGDAGAGRGAGRG